MSDSRPIGVFDSGVGGLTVLRELRHQLPVERLLYVADLEHFPYGPRPQRQVRDLAMGIIAMMTKPPGERASPANCAVYPSTVCKNCGMSTVVP